MMDEVGATTSSPSTLNRQHGSLSLSASSSPVISSNTSRSRRPKNLSISLPICYNIPNQICAKLTPQQQQLSDDPFCDHLKLRTTCFDCNFISDQQQQQQLHIGNDIFALGSSPTSGVDAVSTSSSSGIYLPQPPHHHRRRVRSSCVSSFSCDDQQSPADSIVVTWPHFNAQINTRADDSFDDCREDFEQLSESDVDVSNNNKNEESSKFNWVLVDHQAVTSKLATVQYLPHLITTPKPPQEDQQPPKINVEQLRTKIIDVDLAPISRKIVDNNDVDVDVDDSAIDNNNKAVMVIEPGDPRNKMTEWTLPIIVGTFLLGNLFGFSLEVGATISTVVMYFVKNHAPRLLR